MMTMTIPEMLSGFQWTFETEGLEFVSVSSEDIHIGDENVGILENGIVTMSWNGESKPGKMKFNSSSPGELRLPDDLTR
jgi:hypothetical protein